MYIPDKIIDMNKNRSNLWKTANTKKIKIIRNMRDRKRNRYLENKNLA